MRWYLNAIWITLIVFQSLEVFSFVGKKDTVERKWKKNHFETGGQSFFITSEIRNYRYLFGPNREKIAYSRLLSKHKIVATADWYQMTMFRAKIKKYGIFADRYGSNYRLSVGKYYETKYFFGSISAEANYSEGRDILNLTYRNFTDTYLFLVDYKGMGYGLNGVVKYKFKQRVNFGMDLHYAYYNLERKYYANGGRLAEKQREDSEYGPHWITLDLKIGVMF